MGGDAVSGGIRVSLLHDLATASAAKRHRAIDWPASWWLALAAISFGIILGYRLLTAIWPSLGDAALFLYFGRRMNEGAQLYVDIWDLKPPIIYLVNAAADRTGDQLFAIAGIETAALAAGGWLIWRMLKRASAWPPATAVALLGYSILVSYEAIAEGANYTEIYVIPLAGLSMLLFMGGLLSLRPALLLGAGAAACLAAFAKLPGLAPLLAQGAFLIAMLILPGRRLAAMRALGWLLAGFGSCLAALLALGAWLTDFVALIDGSLLHPLNYAQRPLPGSGYVLAQQKFLLLALGIPVLLAIAAAPAGAAGLVGAARSGTRRDRGLLVPDFELSQYCGLFALWALADVAGALGTGRNYGHYFLPFAASGAAASALLITWARTLVGRTLGQLLLAALAASLLVNSFNAARMSWWRVAPRPPGAEAAVPPPQKDALREIRERARPGDTLAVWENMHALYLQSGVRNALPHLALVNGIDSAYALRTKAPGMMSQLRRCPPKFLVLLSDAPLAEPGARAFEAAVRRLASVQFTRVRLGPAAKSIELWVRRGPAGLSCPNT